MPPGPHVRPLSLLVATLAATLAGTLGLVAASGTAQAAPDDGAVARLTTAHRGEVPGLPPQCKDRPQRCEIGAQRRGAPTLVLWGDSHAWQVIPAIQAALGGRRVNFVTFLYGGCPPHHTRLTTSAEVRAASPCRKLNYRALKYVTNQTRKGRDLRIVLAGGWELYRYALNPSNPGGWEEESAPSIRNAARFTVNATPRLFRTLGRKRIATDVVGQMPTVPTNAPECPAGQKPYSCDLPRQAALPSENYIRAYVLRQRALLTRTGGLIDPTAYFCSADTCAGQVAGESTFYKDNTHISTTLSARLGRYFEPTVTRLVAR